MSRERHLFTKSMPAAVEEELVGLRRGRMSKFLPITCARVGVAGVGVEPTRTALGSRRPVWCALVVVRCLELWSVRRLAEALDT